MTTFDLVPTKLAVQAMRDNGYRNTAYAIAELIDNAIQAKATAVELLCCEREALVQQRNRRNIHQIAVLDNGTGMDHDGLMTALQFGNGAYLHDRSGIGRFGMGLPSSSISQCQRVDVWTWQDGPASALHSYIDLDEVEKGLLTTVPEPDGELMPEMWEEASESLGATGTLVVWSRLDRCLWKTARTIIRNSEETIGRMYRRFIHDGRATIRLAAFVEDKPSDPILSEFAKANDPGYLMVPSSTPAPYDQSPMFREDGDQWEMPYTIEFNGEQHLVTVRFTVADESVRSTPNAGAQPFGKHAARNLGVSLMRADRELMLDTAFVNPADVTERWWAVEVEFPAALDEIFGVTNNKQSARHFTETAESLEEILAAGETVSELIEEMENDDDPRAPLVELVHLIDRRIRGLRKILKVQTKGQRSRKRHEDPDSPEARATSITKTRQEEGHTGKSDEDEGLDPAEREAALAQELEESGLSKEQAKEMAARKVGDGIKYTFTQADLEGRTFFTVKPVAGEIVIKLNINHSAYKNLVEVLEEIDEDLSMEEALDRLRRANNGLRLLLMAWARLEDEATPDKKREDIQDLRTDWGRYAALFLEDDR